MFDASDCVSIVFNYAITHRRHILTIKTDVLFGANWSGRQDTFETDLTSNMAQADRFTHALHAYIGANQNTTYGGHGHTIYDEHLFSAMFQRGGAMKAAIVQARTRLLDILTKSGVYIVGPPVIVFSHDTYGGGFVDKWRVSLVLQINLVYTLSNYMDIGLEFSCGFDDSADCTKVTIHNVRIPDTTGDSGNKIITAAMQKSTEFFSDSWDYLEKKGVPSY